MTAYGGRTTRKEPADRRCDTRVWSGACDHGATEDTAGKYLCNVCGTIVDLNHEVRHEFYSNVSGDYDNLS